VPWLGVFCYAVVVASVVRTVVLANARRCFFDRMGKFLGNTLQVSLLGELSVRADGCDVALPASRKARALLAFLVATGRPHRRERLCELFWDLPDDPRAALRWSLTKLRKVVDSPDRPRIIADRERVSFDASDVDVDLHDVRARLGSGPSIPQLEEISDLLGRGFLEGLEQAGDDRFQSWLASEREDVWSLRAEVLKRLATHPDMPELRAKKWNRLWREADPDGTEPSVATGEDVVKLAPEAIALTASYDRTVSRAIQAEKTQALRTQKIGFCEARDGTKIAFATVGSGPPLLKAANWLTHLEFDWDSPIWGGSFAAIARGRTFIRYDERGCGLSDWEVEDLSFEAFVEDLEVVADRLGLERFPLLGISQGASVSIEYAVRHPERVSGLILLGGYAAGWRHMVDQEEQARREAVMSLTELGWGTDNPAYRHIFSQTFMPAASAETLAWFDEFQRNTTSPGNAARFQDAFGHIDVRQRLAQVRAPTLVVHSKYDQRIPLSMGRELASGILGASFLPLESQNHVLVDDEPAWRVCVEAIADFLAEKHI